MFISTSAQERPLAMRDSILQKEMGRKWSFEITKPHRSYSEHLPWLDCLPMATNREVRAVWFCTYGGLDWPGKGYAPTAWKAEKQKQALRQHFDQLQALGFNTILFQCRIRSTVAYASQYEPWDGAFSGTPGLAPPYDVLAFAVEEAHQRGMELHAYLVVYPICSVAQAKQLGKKALPNLRPDLCVRAKDKWVMDPGVPATATYVANLAREIVQNYNVDGIHLDYIRYPEPSVAFDDAATYKRYGQRQNKAQWRRDNVNRCVRLVSEAVRAVRPWVKLSCAPIGKYSDLAQQSSYGWNARDAVAQDAQLWLKEGWMDMLFPMMYFDKRHFYPFLFNWKENTHGRIVVPGLGTYLLAAEEKNWELDILYRQMQVARALNLGGQAHFRSHFVVNNTKGIADFLRHFYALPMLPPAMSWVDSIAPQAPRAVKAMPDQTAIHLSWEKVEETTPVYYNIYQELEGKWVLLAARIRECHFVYRPVLAKTLTHRLAVRAMDAFGNESDSSIAH